jgi:hypothetical protein
MVPLTDFTEYQLCARMEREYRVDVRDLGFPPEGYSLGGVSGGPMLQPVYQDGAWGWRLAGGTFRGCCGAGLRAHHRGARAFHFAGWPVEPLRRLAR